MFNLKLPQSIFVHADGFLKTAISLNKQPGTPEFDPLCFAALVANSAFASELYLKCLIQMETGQLMRFEHNLFTLFEKLHVKTQQDIDKRFNEVMAKSSPEYDLSKASKDAQDAAARRPKNFREALKTGAEAFIEWRYLYETDGNSNPFGLFNLPGILRAVILERVPQWGIFRLQMIKIADALPTSPALKTPK